MIKKREGQNAKLLKPELANIMIDLLGIYLFKHLINYFKMFYLFS